MLQLQQGISQHLLARYKSFPEKPILAIENGKLVQIEDKQPSTDQMKYAHSALKHTPLKTKELHPVYKPVLFQWRTTEDMNDSTTTEKLESLLNKAMMVYAKYCTATDLFALLKEDTKYWRPFGILQMQFNHSPSLK